MASKKKSATNGHANGAVRALPRALAISEQGIENAHDMMAVHSVMTADVLSGRLDRRIAQTVISNHRTMLAIAEMAYKRGGLKGGSAASAKAIKFLP